MDWFSSFYGNRTVRSKLDLKNDFYQTFGKMLFYAKNVFKKC